MLSPLQPKEHVHHIQDPYMTRITVFIVELKRTLNILIERMESYYEFPNTQHGIDLNVILYTLRMKKKEKEWHLLSMLYLVSLIHLLLT